MLEAVIATSVVTIGIIGLLITSQHSVLIVYLARDRLTAAYLAKEGMETIRNRRDENFLRARPWDEGIASTVTTTLLIDADRFYNYTIGVPTKFTRRITISPISIPGIPAGNVIRAEVWVNWETYTFLLEENLHNWR